MAKCAICGGDKTSRLPKLWIQKPGAVLYPYKGEKLCASCILDVVNNHLFELAESPDERVQIVIEGELSSDILDDRSPWGL